MSSATAPLAQAVSPASTYALDEAVLLTVLYADLFDYPLTEDELHRRLIGIPADRTAVAQAIARLRNTYLAHEKGFLMWRGREHLRRLREHRRWEARAQWKTARRYGRWLACVPFVRMIAVSGSLTVENAEGASDVDFFCITEAKRLWLARLLIVPLSKLTRRLPKRFPCYLCPNYIVALSALEVEDRNLFTAHEVVQATPLLGNDVYLRFLKANAWTARYLPQAVPAEHPAPASLPPPPRLTRWVERGLRGRLGDVLDAGLHRLFVAFYRRRAARRGWHWDQLQRAYQRGRYIVPEGGYVGVVHACFADRVRERLGAHYPAARLEPLFPKAPAAAESACYDWAGLFRQDYGRDEANLLAPSEAPRAVA